MKPRSPQEKVTALLSLAYIDYVAARTLLLAGQLQAALPLGATAVEKEINAILVASGEKIAKSGHLSHSLLHALEKKHPKLIPDEYLPFIRFLMKGYDLRYAQADRDSYSLVINQFRTLIHLDKLMLLLDSPFAITQGNRALNSSIQDAIRRADQTLTTDNVAIDPSIMGSLLARDNKVLEIGIGKNFLDISIAYETHGVLMSGDFLKKPNFNKENLEFQVTFG